MIYVDVSLERWLKKYPFLKVINSTCDECGNIRSTTRPLISKDYIGLESPICDCGKSNNSSAYMVPVSKKEIESWMDVLEGKAK